MKNRTHEDKPRDRKRTHRAKSQTIARKEQRNAKRTLREGKLR